MGSKGRLQKKEINWGDFRKVRALLEREESLRERQLRRKALARAKQVTDLLKNKYRVEKVYLYGSLAWGKFTRRSDIDLLIMGFRDSEHFWRMQVEAEEIASPFPISVVCFEEALPSLRNRVLREGVQI